MMLTDKDICCHFQCFRDLDKTAEVLHRFRLVYPTCPIHLVSDGGLDFSAVAGRYGCVYFHEDINIGRAVRLSEVLMHKWLGRFLRVCESCSEPWLLELEDDVWVRWPMKIPPFLMAGPMHRANHKAFAGPLGKYIFWKHPHLANNGYGGAGGTLVRRDLMALAVRHYLEYESFDNWNSMVKMNASDMWLTAIMMHTGHQYGHNPDLVECNRNRRWRETDCAIVHQWKDQTE